MTVTSETIAFLANSENRVTVLEVLARSPRTRRELLERIDASRVTLARVLRDLEDNHWVTRTGQTYAVTPLGEWVCDEFTRLVEVMETERRLRDVMPWFPADAVNFEVQWLRDAEVVCPTESDPMAPIRRALHQLRGGTRLRILSTQVTPSFFDVVRRPLLHGETTFEGVATPAVYDTITNDPEMSSAFRELADAPTTTFFVVDGLPLILHVVDERVAIGLTDDHGTPRAGIFTRDSTVHAWAVETFETYREEADPLEETAIAV